MKHRLKIKTKHKTWHQLNFIFPSGKWTKELIYPQHSSNGKYVLHHIVCRVCSGHGFEYRYWDSKKDKESRFYKPRYDMSGFELADMYDCTHCDGSGSTKKRYRVR